MVTVPSVELMLTQFQNVHVLLIISQVSIKTKKFVKFVMLDVMNVIIFSTTVWIVPQPPEDLVPHIVLAQSGI
jgi:hypothetical protein